MRSMMALHTLTSAMPAASAPRVLQRTACRLPTRLRRLARPAAAAEGEKLCLRGSDSTPKAFHRCCRHRRRRLVPGVAVSTPCWPFIQRMPHPFDTLKPAGKAVAAPPPPITLTDAALAHLAKLREESGDERLLLRMGVKSGGCSGMSCECMELSTFSHYNHFNLLLAAQRSAGTRTASRAALPAATPAAGCTDRPAPPALALRTHAPPLQRCYGFRGGIEYHAGRPGVRVQPGHGRLLPPGLRLQEPAVPVWHAAGLEPRAGWALGRLGRRKEGCMGQETPCRTGCMPARRRACTPAALVTLPASYSPTVKCPSLQLVVVFSFTIKMQRAPAAGEHQE